jgi:hypothetical protein
MTPRLFATLLLALLLQGCSSLQLAYRQSPTLADWWLDSQLSFDSTQSPQVREALQQLQLWHRERELGASADMLRKLQTLGSNDTDAHQVCEVWSQIEERMDQTMAQAIRLATPIALQLQPRQLRHLLRHWDEKNEEWEKEWLGGSPQERSRRRLERAVSRYEDFYGKLNEAQAELLRVQIQKSAWTPEWGRQERLRRQQVLLATLQRLQQGGLGPQQAEALLQGVWRQWWVPPQAQERKFYQAFVEQTCQNLAELHNSTSAAQRQRATRRLRGYETDLRELLARP